MLDLLLPAVVGLAAHLVWSAVSEFVAFWRAFAAAFWREGRRSFVAGFERGRAEERRADAARHGPWGAEARRDGKAWY